MPSHSHQAKVRATLFVALCAFFFCNTLRVQAQDARKFDEFNDLNTDDVMTHLDRFAAHLSQNQAAHGVMVSYRGTASMPGLRLREIYGFQDYLVNKRGVDPRQISVVDAGIRERNLTELWVLPRGVNLPIASATPTRLTVPLKFDSLNVGDGCIGEFTLVPEEPDEGLKFFAAALNENPTAKGLVLVHPSHRGPFRNVKKLVTSSRSTLITKYQISTGRLISAVESPRGCADIELWLAPPSVVIPEPTSPALFFQSQLMAEAERERYTVRRVEFIGNGRTRDKVVRRRFVQNESDIFRRSLLQQGLRNISQLRQLHPVTINDVEVHLNKDEKTIDFEIYLWEQTRSGKR